MATAARDEIVRIDRAVTALLDEWTAQEKRRNAIGDRALALRTFVLEMRAQSLPAAQAMSAVSHWLDAHGDAMRTEAVHRADVEALVEAVEYLAAFRGSANADPVSAEGARLSDLLERIVRLIRESAKRVGLEYTPAGLIETLPGAEAESHRVRRSLLERLKGFEDIKAAYKQALEFQQERLNYFYQDDAHLLTVLDYQLKNLEARPSADDEFFAACLLYFLRVHNYQVAPYVTRFRKATAQTGRAGVWEQQGL
jgi:hypothetical protein